jgi:hypothetical protein
MSYMKTILPPPAASRIYEKNGEYFTVHNSFPARAHFDPVVEHEVAKLIMDIGTACFG